MNISQSIRDLVIPYTFLLCHISFLFTSLSTTLSINTLSLFLFLWQHLLFVIVRNALLTNVVFAFKENIWAGHRQKCKQDFPPFNWFLTSLTRKEFSIFEWGHSSNLLLTIIASKDTVCFLRNTLRSQCVREAAEWSKDFSKRNREVYFI